MEWAWVNHLIIGQILFFNAELSQSSDFSSWTTKSDILQLADPATGSSVAAAAAARMGSVSRAFLFFFVFYYINRGGLPTASENPPFTVTNTQRRLELTASVNNF